MTHRARPIPKCAGVRSANFRALALVTSLALIGAPPAWGVHLRQTPPGSAAALVPPNVILSIDDSGHMALAMNRPEAGNDARTPDDPDWGPQTRRINVLAYSLESLLASDSSLVDGGIRLAWQAMWNNGGAPGVGAKASDPSYEITCLQYTSSDATECATPDPTHTRVNKNTGGADSVTKNNADSDPGHGVNSMQTLHAGHRRDFIEFVHSLTPGGERLAHRMFMKADRYLRAPLGHNSPWATRPGSGDEKPTEYLGCRRNYHLFISSGSWDEVWPDDQIGNADGNAVPPYGDTHENTLADWAFHSWNHPLQNPRDLSGTLEIPADYAGAAESETFTTNARSVTLPKHDDPRFDPSTQPHLSTYVIGLGMDGRDRQRGSLQMPGGGFRLPFVYGGPDGGSFVDLASGARTWPAPAAATMAAAEDNALDLWHAALNGRGRFYGVEQPVDLQQALEDVFGAIQAQSAPAWSRSGGTALTGASSQDGPVGSFTASYAFDPEGGWRGDIRPGVIDTADRACTGAPDGASRPDCPRWGHNASAAALLDGLDDPQIRKLISTNDATGRGVPFTWESLSTQQRDSFKVSASEDDEIAKLRLAYIRGSHAQEIAQGGTFRNRVSRLGDISDSVPWYTGAPSTLHALPGYRAFASAHASRPPMLYVGANDGMLHGFSATSGQELFAYIPRAVVADLKALANPAFNYRHRPYVNGSPLTGDADLGSSAAAAAADWRTVLVGTLGAGGRGYFVLDVTQPDRFSGDSVLLDKTQGQPERGLHIACRQTPDQDACDIGFITARPAVDADAPNAATQITRLNNGRWAVLLGNGYNSANRRPVLLIQYLDGQRELRRLAATDPAATAADCAAGTAAEDQAAAPAAACDNGLATPRVVDIDGNGTADVAYAGDNLGNLWKFDLTAPADQRWKVAFDGQPLFTALGPGGAGGAGDERSVPQPISVAPLVRAHDRFLQVKITNSNHESATRPAPVRGLMVAFGTGRDVAVGDAQDRAVQTLYAVLDRTSYQFAGADGTRHLINASAGAARLTPSDLATRTVAAQTSTPSAESIGAPDGQALSATTWSTLHGWYLDLPESGERIVEAPAFYRGSNVMTVWSQAPRQESDADSERCDPPATDGTAGKQYRSFINIMDGMPPSVPLLFAPDGTTPLAAEYARREVAPGAHALVAVDGDLVRDTSDSGESEILPDMPASSLRPSWRQLQ